VKLSCSRPALTYVEGRNCAEPAKGDREVKSRNSTFECAKDSVIVHKYG
jgi:hypothetical protein